MKLILGAMALVGLMLSLTGCETLVDTSAENKVRVDHAMYTDLMQVPDDTERILYIDKPTGLSRLPLPNN